MASKTSSRAAAIRADDIVRASERNKACREYAESQEPPHDPFYEALTTAFAMFMLLFIPAGITKTFLCSNACIEELAAVMDPEYWPALCLFFGLPVAGFGTFFLKLSLKKDTKGKRKPFGRRFGGGDVLFFVITCYGFFLAAAAVAIAIGLLAAFLTLLGLPDEAAAFFYFFLAVFLPSVYLLYLAGSAVFMLVRHMADMATERNLVKGRKKAVRTIEKALSGGARVICRKGSAASLMPDGRVRELPVGKLAGRLLPEDCTIRAREDIEPLLAPALGTALEARRYRDVKGWAKGVRRDAKRKCRRMKSIDRVIDIRGRLLTGLTKDGRVRQICFEENIYTLFEGPGEILGKKAGAGRMLREKLVPLPVLIELEKEQLKQGC